MITPEQLASVIATKTREIEAACPGLTFPYRCRPCIEGFKPVPSSVSSAWVHPDYLTGRVKCGYSNLLNECAAQKTIDMSIL